MTVAKRQFENLSRPRGHNVRIRTGLPQATSFSISRQVIASWKTSCLSASLL